ncbi:tyrosine-type recombinase/integrase [Herbaspirillum sp. GCM10030257]|uniref:tyrosine-type recombinase/integrase n=1 Tax=Herbaspirillum sp. GCM10030257 TaxID=3273393 RepID=UPI00361838F7
MHDEELTNPKTMPRQVEGEGTNILDASKAQTWEDVERWLSNYQGHTLRAYKREIKGFVSWILNKSIPDLASVTRNDCREYFSTMSIKKANYAGFVLLSMYRWAIMTGRVKVNPVEGAIPSALGVQTASDIDDEEETSTKFLERKELKLIIQAVRQLESTADSHYALQRWIFWLFLLTGVTRTEISGSRVTGLTGLTCGMMKEEIFQDPNSDLSIKGWCLSVPGINRKLRLVPLPGMLLDELRRYHRYSAELLPDTELNANTSLVIGKGKQPMSDQALYRNVKALGEKVACRLNMLGHESEAAIASQLSPRLLRNTHTYNLIALGVDLHTAAEIAGRSWREVCEIAENVASPRNMFDAFQRCDRSFG